MDEARDNAGLMIIPESPTTGAPILIRNTDERTIQVMVLASNQPGATGSSSGHRRVIINPNPTHAAGPSVPTAHGAGHRIDTPATTSSEKSHTSSHFSLEGLPDNHPLRRIRAAEVRRQAAAIPLATQPAPDYPHRFRNRERIRLRDNRGPLIEHPLAPEGRGPWVPAHGRRAAGPARIIVSEANRSRPEVVYHDPQRAVPEGSTHQPFAVAVYRARTERRVAAAAEVEAQSVAG
ncbi:28069de4-5fc0-4bde-9b2c-3d2c56314afc [Thermothielavioides terrestris]|uniref:28069de4-5fc0-4bde-9b2c-3d2c56314afc n=1 Tax=Thermothielavioides terrestris TaxID=2587410 RepID=A0A446BSC3_9PEZI|nr:28069de4-5fc0-4bde-9b2c-3d2c56314afc [Thermothielavioides terrestris]